jgi:hypothetical protein
VYEFPREVFLLGHYDGVMYAYEPVLLYLVNYPSDPVWGLIDLS